MLSSTPSLIALAGPTASGKTDAALKIAKEHDGEIVLADSRQVYIGMNIGTNKVHTDTKIYEKENKKIRTIDGVPYWGIDLVKPDKLFTVQQWKEYAQKKIAEIVARDHLPVIEGGTGLYVWALLDNLTIPEVPPDPKLRKEIEKQIAQKGLQSVVHEILKKDPEAAAFLQLDNPRRVIRALEIIRKTGIPFSQQRGQGPKLYNDIRIGIDRPLKELDQRIAIRAREQLEAGLENEVRALIKKLSAAHSTSSGQTASSDAIWKHPSMSGIGYIEWKDYFTGSISKEDVLERIVRHTKQYARAQRTWFQRDKSIQWVTTPQEAVQLAATLLPTIEIRSL